MKECRTCKSTKSLDAFYTHKDMPDGHLNICKVCIKSNVKKRYKALTLDPAFVEKERARGRDKYKRLYATETPIPMGKAESIRKYQAAFPEKRSAVIKSQRIKVGKGLHRHHWSYNPEHAKDIIPLPVSDHFMVHRYMQYDQNNMMYRTKDGELLDTKEKHERFILSLIKKSA